MPAGNKTSSQQQFDAAVGVLAQEYAAARLEEHIRRIVAAAPPLSDTQLDRLAAALRGGRDG
jgi:hypothetical protein